MLPIRREAPWYFSLAQRRIASGQRGGYMLWRVIERAHRQLGVLDQCAPFALDDRETILMPLYWPQLLRKDRVRDYEHHQVAAFAGAIDRLGPGTTLLDCGADVGLFTRLVLTRTRHVACVRAIEPNPVSHAILARNLALPGLDTQAIWAAVSNFSGRATLRQAEYSDDNHARFIQHGGASTADGDTPVLRLDSLDLPPGRPLAIKIDVEGEELAAIEGAASLLAAAPAFVVQIEANVDVVARTALDPVAIVQAVQAIRPTTLQVLHDHKGVIGTTLDPTRPFFAQYPGNQSCDILLASA